jgi:hypothetical protein
MNITKRFADKIFTIGFRVAFKFFRRPTVQAVATEPDRADGQADPMPPAMNWLTAPIGPAQTWEAALSGAAQRQQAKQPLN